MRFIVMVKANKDSEAGVLPDQKLLTEMGKYNEELVKAGVLLAAEGLQPSSKGARVRFSGTKRTVIVSRPIRAWLTQPTTTFASKPGRQRSMRASR